MFDGVDMTQFSNGIHDTVYEKLGAHPMTIEGVKGTYFAVWAPEAKAVSVVGDFNDRRAPRNRCAIWRQQEFTSCLFRV